ncbi:MAG: biosynthetic-type acetolactate synthase large subunit [Pseudomonadales bacterium]|nr:biosynthetic-type acetolactate synthase large subunit [Pseudomonadales bacterium]
MNGAACLIEILNRLGTSHIFGYPGGAIMPVYDALACLVKDHKMHHILCRHEQACAFSAQGYARAMGQVGVCMATSGPGATNLVTGIADAHLDSIPLLIITGQIETGLIGTDAFQAVDMLGITHGIVKHGFQVTDINHLVETVIEAYRLCTSGRPGPVLIDLPKDIQKASIDNFELAWQACSEDNPISQFTPTTAQLAQAVELLEQARSPVLMAGGGIKIANAESHCVEFLHTNNLPTVTTLNCMGLLPMHHPLNLGMLGMHGTAKANDAVQAADLIICIGARFDDRATGRVEQFAPKAEIIHVDIDAAELNKNVQSTLGIIAEADIFLAAINQWQKKCVKQYSNLVKQCANKQPVANDTLSNPPASNINKDQGPIYAADFLRQLNQHTDENSLISVDVGQHQMWVAQHFDFSSTKQFLSSSGLGSMGFGLPAAIGAQFAQPEKTLINITGDGSFMMNVQELATIKRYQLPIKIILFNNQHLGLVRQQQELFYAENYSEVELFDNPDFTALVRVFGFQSETINTPAESNPAISRLFQQPGPAFLEVKIPALENVWPMVPPGAPNSTRLTATKRQYDVS